MVLLLNVRQGRKSSIRRLEALSVDRTGPAVDRILLLHEPVERSFSGEGDERRRTDDDTLMRKERRKNLQDFLMTTRFDLREMRHV